MKIKAKKLYNTKDMTRREWLQARKSGIGGSDAAAITGLNKYSSPLGVFLDKTEPLNEVEDGQISEAAEWGNRHEPTIRAKFKENHPELRIQRSFIMWQSVEHPFMLANVDGLLFHPEKGWGILEIKTSSEWRNDEWGDEEIVEEYLIQVQHYLATMGLDWGYFAVLIGGNKYREFYVERDNELIDSLIQIEKEFWNDNVMANNPPAPDGSDSSNEVLNRIYPVDMTMEITEIKRLGDEVVELIEERESLDAEKKRIEERKKEIDNLLKGHLGDFQVGEAGERKITWKPSRAFSEEKLKKEQPDIYEKFSVPTLDKKAFKKAYPKMYGNCMEETGKRTLGVKEDEIEYIVGVA
jgi:putative phage-type endonuclease